jgi:uncharacterized protein YegP (UPF0339 family)
MGLFKKEDYKFETFVDKKKEYRFRMIAPNKEIILASEGYEDYDEMLDTIDVIKKFAKIARIECKC